MTYLVILSPTRSGLQKLLNSIKVLINEANLIINLNKTVVLIFRRRSTEVFRNLCFLLQGRKLEIVDNVKYLGCELFYDLNENRDIERCMKSFNKSFASFYRHFSSVHIEVLLPLFFTFCTSFYGSELWADRSKCIASFKQLVVSYHAALKKILGVPRFYSNHLTCSALNTFIPENFIS